LLEQAPAAARRPHIVSPVSGAVYALDPDIPVGRQRIRFVATGVTAGQRWRLDARDLGDAANTPAILPPPGVHHLTLIGADGQAQDRVLFTVH
jgi:penicillin-binding protein 1C